MSNLGIKEIKIPSNLEVSLKENKLYLKSDYGNSTYNVNPSFKIDILKEKYIKFYPIKGVKLSRKLKSIWGTNYSLIKNKIIGLSQGYTIKLSLVGVGFRATVNNNKLSIKIGYSHDISYDIPKDVIIECPKQDKIIIFGIDKQKVNEVSSEIQALKKIDPYKGKGILIEDIKLRLKEGKKK
jgi:large subunit ribosomal protein L6